MKIELICVGTELLEGKLNTNVSYIGEKVFSLGFGVDRATTIGDSKSQIERAFTEAISRSDVIISTGGLGPTFDDLTVECVSSVLAKKTTLSVNVFKKIETHFQERNIQMPLVNKKQAYIIEGAKIIENKIGTAPGQIIELKDPQKIIFLLPGPPRELHPMFESTVAPFLRKHETKLRKSSVIHVFGLSESAVETRIQKIISDEKIVDKGMVNFAILAHQGIIDIKITASASDELLIDETLHNLKKEFSDALEGFIYGYDSETLESVVGLLLLKNKLTLSVAESCSAGMLSSKIANISGSSHYFLEGFIVYSDASKIKRLGVNAETIEKYGAVSRETADEMLEGLKKMTSSYCGLSVTGIAGPSAETSEKPVGVVYIGVHTPISKSINEFRFSGTRNEIREKACLSALDILRKELLKFK